MRRNRTCRHLWEQFPEEQACVYVGHGDYCWCYVNQRCFYCGAVEWRAAPLIRTRHVVPCAGPDGKEVAACGLAVED